MGDSRQVLSLRSVAAAVLAGLCTLAPPPALTQAPSTGGTISVSVGGGYSDNLRVVEAAESGSYGAVGLISDWARQGPRLAVGLAADLEYRDYSVADLDNELYGSAEVSAEVQAVPDRFSWFFGNSMGQTRPNAFQINRPENRDRLNVFSTGPRINLPIASRLSMQFEGTQSRRTFDDYDQFDSDSRSISVALVRALSSTAQIALQHVVLDYEFDIGILDNEIASSYVSYRRRLASGSAAFAVGRSRVKQAADEDSTPYLNFSWARDVGARSNLSLAFTQEYVDSFRNFRSFDPTDVLLTGDVQERSTVRFDYAMQAGRNRIGIGGYLNESDYVHDDALDNEQNVIHVDLSRAVSPRLDMRIGLYRSERDFKPSGTKDKYDRIQLSLHRSFSGPLGLSVTFAHYARDGLEPAAVDENTVTMYLTYALKSGDRPR